MPVSPEDIEQLKEKSQVVRHEGITLAQWIRRPENFVSAFPEEIRRLVAEDIWSQVETDLKYEGYIRRELESVARHRRQEEHAVPMDLDYASIPGLRNESRQKLTQVRPSGLTHQRRDPGRCGFALRLDPQAAGRGATTRRGLNYFP